MIRISPKYTCPDPLLDSSEGSFDASECLFYSSYEGVIFHSAIFVGEI